MGDRRVYRWFVFLGRSKRLGTGLPITDGRRCVVVVGCWGAEKGGTRGKSGGAPEPRFSQTPRIRGAVEAHGVCVCVGGVLQQPPHLLHCSYPMLLSGSQGRGSGKEQRCVLYQRELFLSPQEVMISFGDRSLPQTTKQPAWTTPPPLIHRIY